MKLVLILTMMCLATSAYDKIYVVDSATSDRERLKEMSDDFKKILEEEKLSGVPLLIFANKQDLHSASTASSVAASLGLANIRDRNWQLQPCSAISGEAVHDGIVWIARALGKQTK